MAVAVKTSPGARSDSPTVNPAVLSLVGVAYLLGCLWVVFKGLPWLWWSAFESAGLAGRFSVELGIALVLVALAVGVGLLLLGARLLRPYHAAGVRGGVFLGFVGLLVVLGLARWATVWIEHWCYDLRWFGPSTGLILSAAVAGLLALGGLWLFFTPRAQRFAALLEAGGWFQATAYKSNQGQKVRRATIVGILLLVGAGVWTLINHGTLRRGPADWNINIPFTAKVAIENMGDAQPFLAKALPAADKDRVQVRAPGAANFRVDQLVTAEQYRNAAIAQSDKDGAEAVDRAFTHALTTLGVTDEKEADASAVLVAVNRVIADRMKELLEERGADPVFPPVVRRRLEPLYYNRTADLSPVIKAFEREAVDLKKRDKLGPAFDLPAGVLVVGEYALRDINDEMENTKHVRVGDSDGTFPLRFNAVVTTEEFGRAEVEVLARAVEREFRAAGKLSELEELKKSSADGAAFREGVAGALTGRAADSAREAMARVRIPAKLDLAPASGPVTYASIPLLPAVRYTVPLLLLVLSLWLAWRVVNMPTFADFLIATEAELNKVSWTTQRRLFQDTIVVLVTVVLMAVFLFVTDYTWKVVLGWEPIGVLYIPEQKDKDAKQSVEQKRW